MTRVSFYVLSSQRADGRLWLACRIAEKAYKQRKRIYLYCADAATAARLDELLWTFRQGSFVPHERAGEEAGAPVIIGDTPPPASEADVLINLDHEVPDFFSRFERVAEIVGNDNEARSLARRRYQFYRDRGYALESHQVAV